MANKYTRIKNTQGFSTQHKSELIKAFRAHYTPTLYKADSAAFAISTVALSLSFAPNSFFTVQMHLAATAARVLTPAIVGSGATMLGLPATLTPGVLGTSYAFSVITGAAGATVTFTNGAVDTVTLLKGSFIVVNEVE